MSEFKNKILSGIAWSTIAQIATQFIRFIISVILARLLTPEDFGLVAMIAVFTGFAGLFREMGFGAALIQNQGVEERHYSSIFWLNLVVGFVLMWLVASSAPWIAAFYDEPRLFPLTLLIAIIFFMASFNVIQTAILKRALNFHLLAVIEIISAIVAGTVSITLAVAGYGVWSLAWQMLILTAMQVGAMWILTDWRPQFHFEKRAIRELLKFSSNLLGFNTFNYCIRNADNILIGKFVGSTGLGVYTRAYSTMLLPLSEISRVVGRVMFPALSKIQDDKLRVKRLYLRSIQIIALLTFPLMCGLLVVSDAFVLALFGPKWEAVILILQILCPVGLVQSLGTTTGWIYQSQGRTDWMFRWGIAAGILTLIAFVIGIQWGVTGVAIAYVIRVYMLLYFNFRIPGKLIGMTFSDVMRRVTGVFGCAVAMAAAVWALGLILPPNWAHWAYLAVQVPFGMVVYGALVHIFSLEAYREVRELISEQVQVRFRSMAASKKAKA